MRTNVAVVSDFVEYCSEKDEHYDLFTFVRICWLFNIDKY